MAIFGNTARVSVDVGGGGITALNVGTQDKLVVYARGDPDNGTASTNDPTQISGPAEADEAFGAGTPLAQAIRDAAGNGVGFGFITGVMPDVVSVTAEAVAGGSGTLANVPVVEDLDRITATNTTDSADAAVEFRFDSPPTAPSAEQTVHINPNTGEVEAGDGDDYEISYESPDFQSAFDAGTGVIQEQEQGEWRVHTESESVVADALATVTPLRQNQFKMVRISAAAEPNANSGDSPPAPRLDVGSYDDGLDDDALFLSGPERRPDGSLVGGAVAGLLAGAGPAESVLGDSLNGVTELDQSLNVPDQTDLADKRVIPISNSGTPTLEANVSSSTATDFTRDFFTVRLRDRLVLTARALGQAARGRLNNENTEELVEQRLTDELVELVEDGVLRPNTDDETRFFANADQDPTDPKELDVSFGFTPVGVVSRVDVDLTIEV